MSSQGILRYEQCLQPNPSPKLINFYVQEDPDTDIEFFTTAYFEFQLETRVHNFGLLEPFKPGSPVGFLAQEAEVNPIRYWLDYSELSSMGMAKAYCISLVNMHTVLKQPWVGRNLPSQITYALHESGYSSNLLEELEFAWDRFKTSSVAKNRRTFRDLEPDSDE